MKRASAGLIPALFISVVLAASFFAPAPSIKYSLVSCTYTSPAPTVTMVSPIVGNVSGGTSVTITGTQFCNGLVNVKFGATLATAVTVVSNTQITATSPAHATGLVDVTVTTAGGTSATSPADQFTYWAACTGATLVPVPASPKPAGTSVTLNATAATCANPRFEFWGLLPGSTTWQLIQAYSPSASTGGPLTLSGDYHFVVWARDLNSPGTVTDPNGTYDTFAEITYTITPKPCTGITVSALPASPQLAGTPVTITGAATGCPNPLYEFWILTPGSSTWTLAQAYSPSASFNWSTVGPLAPGIYTFSVWARDTSSAGTTTIAAGSYDVFANITYTLTTQPCTAVGVVTSPSSPQLSGTPVTITGNATGCPSPRYEFWILAPGSSTWTLVKAYSTAAVFNWNTTGGAPGVYNISVWARDASSMGTTTIAAGSYDVFHNTTYTLTTQPCTAVGVTPSPASPQLSGTPVMITGNATGCPSPNYEFWILAPGSSTWTLVQAYSSSAVFNWITTGGAPGVYNISVWARDNSSLGTTSISAGTYDTFHNITYTLTTQPCTGVTVLAAPTSPRASGTPITITGNATGCPSPRYEFWMLAPGSTTWTLVKAYSASAVFNWVTTGLAPGIYNFSVWARDNSSMGTTTISAGSYDVFSNIAYTLT